MGKTNNAKYRPDSQQNLVLNSAFDFWQEGTSFASVADSTYCSDLMKYFKTGAMVHTVSRSTDVPANSIARFSLNSVITTVDTSIAAGEYAQFTYPMEGNDLQKIKGKKFTLSFKVKATKVGTYCVSLRNGPSTTRSYVAEYTVNATNTWETKEIVIEHDPTGTWNYDTSLGMFVTWTLACGTTYQTTPGSWQSGSFLATANQVNACDFLANSFSITEIKINPGVGAGDYCKAGESLTEELSLVQRYFRKSYRLEVVPGTAVADGRIQVCVGDTGNSVPGVTWPNLMRDTPTVTLYNQQTGTINQIRRYNGSTAVAVSGVTGFPGGFSDINATTVTGATYDYHYVANARF